MIKKRLFWVIFLLFYFWFLVYLFNGFIESFFVLDCGLRFMWLGLDGKNGIKTIAHNYKKCNKVYLGVYEINELWRQKKKNSAIRFKMKGFIAVLMQSRSITPLERKSMFQKNPYLLLVINWRCFIEDFSLCFRFWKVGGAGGVVHA